MTHPPSSTPPLPTGPAVRSRLFQAFLSACHPRGWQLTSEGLLWLLTLALLLGIGIVKNINQLALLGYVLLALLLLNALVAGRRLRQLEAHRRHGRHDLRRQRLQGRGRDCGTSALIRALECAWKTPARRTS